MERISFNSDIKIEDKNEYLEALKEKGDRTVAAKLDRSEFFRFKGDYEVLTGELENILKEKSPHFSFLDIGVGNMEEPLSYLAVIHYETEKRDHKLEDICEFDMVDIRPKEEIKMKSSLGKGPKFGAFLPEEKKSPATIEPRLPKKGYEHFFEFSEAKGEYEFKTEVVGYLEKQLNNQDRAHFGIPVENFLRDLKIRYDFIACNNVLQHLGGIDDYRSPVKDKGLPQEEYKKYFDVASKILNAVKPGGIIFMHTSGDMTDNEGRGTGDIIGDLPFFKENFEQVALGVFRRKVEVETGESDIDHKT
ncbi:MAG: hypothetical protein V1770_02565 [bacterium]